MELFQYIVTPNRDGGFDLTVIPSSIMPGASGSNHKLNFVPLIYTANFDTEKDALTAAALIRECTEEFNGMA